MMSKKIEISCFLISQCIMDFERAMEMKAREHQEEITARRIFDQQWSQGSVGSDDSLAPPSPKSGHCDPNQAGVLSILQLLEHSEDQSQRAERFAAARGFIQNMATENVTLRRELEASKRLKEELTNFYKKLLEKPNQKKSDSETSRCVSPPTYKAVGSWGGGGQRND